MILYVNGDSHSHGMTLHPHERFSDIIGRELGVDVVNAAQIGASNACILRTTMEYISAGYTPDLMLIGWTTWEREEWQYLGKYYNVNSSGSDSLPKELVEVYKDWVTQQNAETLYAKSRYWHNQIYNLHLDLEQRNIKHVFFNCMYNFFQENDHCDWNNQFIEPYNNDASYYWYLKQQGFNADEWYHYGADAHRAWADYVIKYIKRNHIL
jgi:hypothetical protein